MRFLKAAALAAAVAALLLAVTVFATLRNGVAAIAFVPAAVVAIADLLDVQNLQLVPEPHFDSPEGALRLTYGVASGDVTATTAEVWARASGPSEVIVEFWDETAGEVAARSVHTGAIPERDHAVIFRLEGLAPNAAHAFRVWAEGTDSDGRAEQSPPMVGRFRTAPDPSIRRDTSFVFSGDLGGGGYCRRADSGYAIFDAMRELEPDFFIALGDMIYADNTCPATNPVGEATVPGGFRSVSSRAVDWTSYERVREVYFQHWRYNRADERFQAFLSQTPMYVLWDDHEIVNDSGASWAHANVTSANRVGYATLAAAARDALFAYNPIARDPTEPNRLYRHVSWGADLDLFLLDTRSYRSRNDLADTPDNQKAMLGREQLQWLKSGLAQSRATWKVVATSVPLSIPTGGIAAALYGRDAWANGTSWDYSSQTGFERELLDLLGFGDATGVQNVVFLSGDAHQAVEIRYSADLDGGGRPFLFHEIVAGPLSAPAVRSEPQLDPTLNPTMLYREAGFFNFGYIRIERSGDGLAHLIADVRGVDGQPRPGSRLDLTPAP